MTVFYLVAAFLFSINVLVSIFMYWLSFNRREYKELKARIMAFSKEVSAAEARLLDSLGDKSLT